MGQKILIIEDETAQAQVLKYNLDMAGFETVCAETGSDGIALMRAELPDLVILDWMLPDMSGIDVCKTLKSDTDTKTIPIIMLTARGDEDDKVRGLTVGADDFVVKPHSNKELIARIKANLRRAGEDNETFSFADITMNIETHRVRRGDDVIKLGPTEFKLLKTFLSRPKKVWSRAQLLDRVWGTDIYVDERTVDVHMGRLRKAINAGGRNDVIRTIRGAGYALDENI